MEDEKWDKGIRDTIRATETKMRVYYNMWLCGGYNSCGAE